MTTLDVVAPLPGTLLALADVPDPVFSAALVGPGLAIDPARDSAASVVSPVSGQIVKLHPHAFVVRTPGGAGILTHLGVDTIQLHGVGFELHRAEGDVVNAGDLLVTWNPSAVESGGRSPVVPVIALDAAADAVTAPARAGRLAAGDLLFRWSLDDA